MINILLAMTCCVVQAVSEPPELDGIVVSNEYGDSSAVISKANAPVVVRFARHESFVYIAATIPDTSYYWGDDFVISLDPDGSGGEGPGPADRQWYIRRMTDSSVVVTADSSGRWYTGQPPMLGQSRSGPDWTLATTSAEKSWAVELRIDESLVTDRTRIAFRTYDDNPHGWWSLPEPAEGQPPHRVERSPNQWLPFRTDRHQSCRGQVPSFCCC